jgi:hypothetical protein
MPSTNNGNGRKLLNGLKKETNNGNGNLYHVGPYRAKQEVTGISGGLFSDDTCGTNSPLPLESLTDELPYGRQSHH